MIFTWLFILVSIVAITGEGEGGRIRGRWHSGAAQMETTATWQVILGRGGRRSARS